ncbi:hypothetical protein ADL03_21295 [Nocardia sp. NRRL S-836]|nr:hypothetical protein ADL03_21295 [Nocardia sp. NRRL S-836]
MIARPVLTISTTRIHMRVRTRAVTFPTKTPGEISSSQRVRCPRSPTGQAATTMTVIRHLYNFASTVCVLLSAL